MTKDNQHIPSGYKLSPLGIIPEDWEVKRLGEVCNFLRNNTLSRKQLNDTNGKVQNIHYGDILVKYPSILNACTESIPYVNQEDYKDTLTDFIEDGDVIMADTAEDETVGKACEITNVDSKQILAGLHTMLFRPQKGLFASSFLGYHINSNSYRKQLNTLMQGIKVCSLGKQVIANTFLLLPPLHEQKRICDLLSLWDTAIAKQTTLIEKLILRKRGLMQQLLTGKKRLKGFEGEWKRIKLGDIAERITRKNEEDNQNVVTISAQRGFVVQTDFFNRSVASETLDNYFLVHKDEFCYNKSYSNGYPMGAIKRLKTFDKAVVTTLYICFALKGGATNIDFFEQYCESGIFNNELVKVANEGGRAHGLLNVIPSDFFNMHKSVPSINEQNAIASVLVNADKEIEIQKQKLAALQEQKKGLMQVLLTGKKRIK
jgi:type I restriction enzyme S subunit